MQALKILIINIIMNEDFLHLFNLITENVINHKENPHEAIIKNRNLTGENYVLVIGKMFMKLTVLIKL